MNLKKTSLSLRFLWPQGVRKQLTLLYVSAFGAFLLVFSYLVFANYNRSLLNEFDAALYNYTLDVTENIIVDLFGRFAVSEDLLEEQRKIFPFPLGESFVQLRTIEGRTLLRSRSLVRETLPYDEEILAELRRRGVHFITYEGSLPGRGGALKEGTYRQINYLVRKRPMIKPLVLQISVPMSLLEKQKFGFLGFLGFSIPIFLLAAALCGFYLSRQALDPVRKMIERANALGAGNLSGRIPVPRADDELKELALTFNDLLQRLETAFISQDRFISNASHQLRTPLTIMRGELDVLRTKNRSVEEIDEFLKSASDEIDHLASLVEQLLQLARVEAGRGSIEFKLVRLDDLLLDTVGRLQKLAERREVQLRFNLSLDTSPIDGSSQKPESDSEDECMVRGDEELLITLLQNLLENAIKYSPRGSIVSVLLESEASVIRVIISDQGPGIPLAQRERIFERFFRSPEVSTTEGAGLGLSIAKKIADAHNAALSVQDNTSPQRTQQGPQGASPGSAPSTPFSAKGAQFLLEFPRARHSST